jgi:hypothetical protein
MENRGTSRLTLPFRMHLNVTPGEDETQFALKNAEKSTLLCRRRATKEVNLLRVAFAVRGIMWASASKGEYGSAPVFGDQKWEEMRDSSFSRTLSCLADCAITLEGEVLLTYRREITKAWKGVLIW